MEVQSAFCSVWFGVQFASHPVESPTELLEKARTCPDFQAQPGRPHQMLEGAIMQQSSAQEVSVDETSERPKQRRGFAVMDRDTLRSICAQGGRTAHANGRAHQFNAEEASRAGKKGGAVVGANREYMAVIGQRGGKAKKGFRKRAEHEAAATDA
jgi:hypothetical protein